MKPKKQITITELGNEKSQINIDNMSGIEAIGYLTYFRDMLIIKLMNQNEI